MTRPRARWPRSRRRSPRSSAARRTRLTRRGAGDPLRLCRYVPAGRSRCSAPRSRRRARLVSVALSDAAGYPPPFVPLPPGSQLRFHVYAARQITNQSRASRARRPLMRMAVDDGGFITHDLDGSWSPPAAGRPGGSGNNDVGSGFWSGVSCPIVGWCMAVSVDGFSIYSNGGWSRPGSERWRPRRRDRGVVHELEFLRRRAGARRCELRHLGPLDEHEQRAEQPGGLDADLLRRRGERTGVLHGGRRRGPVLRNDQRRDLVAGSHDRRPGRRRGGQRLLPERHVLRRRLPRGQPPRGLERHELDERRQLGALQPRRHPAVSCTAPANCAVVDGNGGALYGSGGTAWDAGQIFDRIPARAMSAISCATRALVAGRRQRRLRVSDLLDAARHGSGDIVAGR